MKHDMEKIINDLIEYNTHLSPKAVIASEVFELDCSCEEAEIEIAGEMISTLKHIKGQVNLLEDKKDEAMYYRCIQMSFFEDLDYGTSIRFPWFAWDEDYEIPYIDNNREYVLLSLSSREFQDNFIPALIRVWEELPS